MNGRILPIVAALIGALLWAPMAVAQSSPGLTHGQVPTAAQWNSYFSRKADYPITTNTITNSLGYVPLNAALAPSKPLVHPSSGNIQCSQGHYLAYVDENWCLSMDNITMTSTDPSALMTITLGGSATAGDVVSLPFVFGTGPCVAGCSASYTVQPGDTLTAVATGLAASIKANANLFAAPNGGYTGGKLIGYVAPVEGPRIDLDFDARASLRLVPTVSGAATETVTLSNANCATACSVAWDVNPTLLFSRFVSGQTPPPDSVLLTLFSASNDSASPSAINRQYGTISNIVVNSTSGATRARWAILTPDDSGAVNQGIYVGRGLHTPVTGDYGFGTSSFVGHVSEYMQLRGPGGSDGVYIRAPAGGTYYRFIPPTTGGTAGQVLTSAGGGGFDAGNPMTWTTLPAFPAGAIVGTTDAQTLTNKTIDASQLVNDSVTNAKLADMAATTLKGNATAGSANPTDVTLGAGLSFNSGALRVTPGAIPGTAANDNATAGNVGEFISSEVFAGSAVPLTSGANANVTSISLTPGDWDVRATLGTVVGGTTSTSSVAGAISLTSAALGAAPAGGAYLYVFTPTTAGLTYTGPVGQRRISVSTTTTVYLVANSNFTVSTSAAFGGLYARRVR